MRKSYLILPLFTFFLLIANANESLLLDKVDDLSKEYRAKNTELTNLNSNTSLLENRLDETKLEIQSLAKTLEQLDTFIKIADEKAKLAENQFSNFKKKLSQINFETQLANQNFDNSLVNYNKLLVDFYIELNSIDTLSIPELNIFNPNSYSNNLENINYLSTLETSLDSSLSKIHNQLIEKRSLQSNIVASTSNLASLKELLEARRLQARITKLSKEKLLEFTKGEQLVYEDLLKKAQEDQLIVEKQVLDILESYSKMKNQLIDGTSLDETFFGKNKNLLSWPVDPSRGITAKFKDTAYKNLFGVPHNAIDIRANMGTKITAPADGVVLKVVGGNGNDYHYIMIAHADGVVSLFGHVYDEYVEVGDKVKRGQVVGLTGGMPGTKGAGFLTTGPHLHFEVFKDGKRIDPLTLLDITKLKSEDLF